MGDYPTQKLDPKFKYCVTNFTIIADYGAASTYERHDCMSCKNALGHTKCGHPCLARPFSLGAHFDRMGCRNGWEAK